MASVQQYVGSQARKFSFTAATNKKVGTSTAATTADYQMPLTGDIWQVVVQNNTVAAATFSIQGITQGGITSSLDPASSTVAQVVAAGVALCYQFEWYGPMIKLTLSTAPGVGENVTFEVKTISTIDDPNGSRAVDSVTVT